MYTGYNDIEVQHGHKNKAVLYSDRTSVLYKIQSLTARLLHLGETTS